MHRLDQFGATGGSITEDKQAGSQSEPAIRSLFKNVEIIQGVQDIENSAFVEPQPFDNLVESKGTFRLCHQAQN